MSVGVVIFFCLLSHVLFPLLHIQRKLPIHICNLVEVWKRMPASECVHRPTGKRFYRIHFVYI